MDDNFWNGGKGIIDNGGYDGKEWYILWRKFYWLKEVLEII